MGKFLDSLNDPSRYVVKRGVPVFQAHHRRIPKIGPDGQPTGDLIDIDVSDEDLPAIAAAANEPAAADRADPVTVGHRHFEDDFPEAEQPPRAAYIWNYRTGRGNDGRPAIIADIAYDRDLHDSYGPKRYPYFSVDYLVRAGKIHGGAVLIRRPALDLGVIPYQSLGGGDFTVRYCDCHGATYMADETTTKGDDWTAEDEVGYAGFTDLAKSFAGGTAKFAKYCAKYSAMGSANATPPAPAANGNGTPGPDLPTGYAAKILELQESNRQILLREKKTEIRRKLDGLKALGFKYDEEREVAYMASLDEAGIDAHLTYMADHYQHDNGTMIETVRGDTSATYQAGQPTADPTRKPSNHDAALAYLRSHPGTSYDAAIAAVSK